MQNNRTLLLLIILCLAFSCKKEKLSKDYDYLFGKWNWLHTYKNKGQPGFENITPLSDGNNYSVEISEKYIYYYKNEKEEKKRRFKEIEILPGVNDTSEVTFILNLNKKDVLIISYYPNRSYISVYEFPYDSPAGDGITYENYFSK